MYAHGIMFHHFHDDKQHTKSQGSISAEDLDNLLKFIGLKNILPANEFYQRALTNNLKAHDICLTFDDNLKCQYDIALTVLESYGLTAFWFIYTSPLEGVSERLELYRYFRHNYFDSMDDFYAHFENFVSQSEYKAKIIHGLKFYKPSDYLKEFPFYTKGDKVFRYIRDELLNQTQYYEIMDKMMQKYKFNLETLNKELWMNKDCIKSLNEKGNIIGLHSHTHPTSIDKLSFAEQAKEYIHNNDILRNILGENIYSVSYPCNSFNTNTFRIMKNLGVKIGFRANMKYSLNNYEIPRLDHSIIFKELQDEDNCIYK